MKPYTYLIGWSELDRYYYGARYAQGCDPSDLLVKYPTSSPVVHQFLSEHGQPDIVEIRQTFDTVDQAREWEHRVLRRMRVVGSRRWLNRTDNRAIEPRPGSANHMYGRTGSQHHRYGVKLSEETKRLIGEKSRQKVMGPEFREKMRQIVTGRRHKESTKAKLSDSLRGRTFTEEHRKNISLNHADCSGEKNSFYGKHHSSETREHLSRVRRGRKWVNDPKTKIRKFVGCSEIESLLELGYQLGKGKW